MAAPYVNGKAQPFVPAVTDLPGCLLLPCDVRAPGQTAAVFDRIGAEWGRTAT